MQQVAEGVKSAPTVCELAEERSVDVPIAQEVAAVVTGQRTAREAYRGLGRIAPGAE
jgi:glycerol-3-phosphate dehydrogenase (NAD(P)+)